ncbi:FAD-dependent oxidoreductase [Myxococcota bacterium]|nr:FAD-dependent oxidoreductase [Myxococcota bacterium]
MQRHECEVLVVGSGGAALVAALAAHDAGARVAVVEKTGLIGGTTAMSGGLVWVPGNPHMLTEGIEDSREDALRYLLHLANDRSDEALVATIVERGPEMIEYLEQATSLAFETTEKPDYHPELPGARPRGRSLAPNVFDVTQLGEWREHLRAGPTFALPMTWRELDSVNGVFHPERLDLALIEARAGRGLVGMGMALVGRLLAAVLERGIPIHRRVCARELILEGKRVVGVLAEGTKGPLQFDASRGVILAAGGFEWNAEWVRRFVAGPMTHPLSCPANQGDSLRMAMAVGSDLANMDDIMRFPASQIPGEVYDDHPMNRMVSGERGLPHAILVNRRGQRFVNEAHNYTDVARAFMAWDPVAVEWANLPCWSIFDQQYRDHYAVLDASPDDPDPAWLVRADDLGELAQKLGMDGEALKQTVERFNHFAAQGNDPDFQRGESLFDRYYADNEAASPTLGTLEKAPFYALPVHCGAIGSTGGPRTNSKGQVMHVSGHPIPGLYAAGDSAASSMGPGYGGPGGPLGQGLTLGYLAGRSAAH